MPNDKPTPTNTSFDHLDGHEHVNPTIGPPKPTPPSAGDEVRSLGMIPYTVPEELSGALDKVTSAIENYTQGGRAAHPILSKLGDATRAAKEYLTGGQSAGLPMGTSSGVINNPATVAISSVPGLAEDAATAEARVREYGPKIAEHAGETARNLRSSLAEDFHGWRNARAPEGSREAGAIPMGKPKPKPKRIDFQSLEGHQDVDPLPGKQKTTETVNIPPKSFIDKVSRGKISSEAVNAKRAQLRAGEELPPAKIWYDADGNVVGADGRHRALAHMQESHERMPVEIIREKPEEKPVTGNPQVAAGAQRYNASIGKAPIVHEPTPLGTQEDRNAMADAFDAMQHNPDDPRVKAAYQAMKTETKAQFNHIKNDMGIKIDFTEKDPYTSAEDMQADVRNNHHLSVFTGGESQANHPASEIDKDTGQTYQNLFRATHDIFGHAAGGFDFSEAGETSAYGAHMQMFSPEAQPAVQHETQGQANWFFNNKDVRNGKPLGDFPPQKAAILPETGKAAPAHDVEAMLARARDRYGDEMVYPVGNSPVHKYGDHLGWITPDGKTMLELAEDRDHAGMAHDVMMDTENDYKAEPVKEMMSNGWVRKNGASDYEVQSITPTNIDAIEKATIADGGGGKELRIDVPNPKYDKNADMKAAMAGTSRPEKLYNTITVPEGWENLSEEVNKQLPKVAPEQVSGAAPTQANDAQKAAILPETGQDEFAPESDWSDLVNNGGWISEKGTYHAKFGDESHEEMNLPGNKENAVAVSPAGDSTMFRVKNLNDTTRSLLSDAFSSTWNGVELDVGKKNYTFQDGDEALNWLETKGGAPTQVNDAQKAVEEAGGVFRGQNKDGMVEVTLPESMTKDLPISEPLKKFVSVTFAPGEEVTPETVRAAMDRKVREYGGVPEETNVVKTTGPQHLERLPQNNDYPGTVMSDIHHELGHVTLGDLAGLSIKEGIRSDRHPSSLASGAAAQVRFNYSNWTGRSGAMSYDEVRPHLGEFLRMLMGGGAAEDAYHDIPMAVNAGMDDDMVTARKILRGLGYSKTDAEERILAAQTQAKNILTQPGLRDMFEKYTATREEGLNENLHMSKKKIDKFLKDFRSLHERNQQAGRNLGGNPAEVAGINEGLDAGTEGTSTQGTGPKVAGQQLTLPGISKAKGEKQDLFEAAAQQYGTTEDLGKAGYIGLDGRMLDFSEGRDARALDHGDIASVKGVQSAHNSNPRSDFAEKTGAARFVNDPKNNYLGIQFSINHPPTAEQLDRFAPLLERGKNVEVEFMDGDKFVGSSGIQNVKDPEGLQRAVADATRKANDDWTRRASQAMTESPAGAIDPRTGTITTPEMAAAPDAKEKFGVEVYPEARKAREPLDHPPTSEDIRNFHKEHEDLFGRHPELRVGWDKTDKGWELNIGAAGPTQAGAELVGRKLDQRAAWDIANQQEVPTGGANEKTKFGQYSLKDRLNDLTGRNVAKLPPTIKFSEHLTDPEKYLLASSPTDLRDYKAIKKKIADVQDIKESAVAGTANRFWYERAKQAFDAVFDSLPKGSFPEEDRDKFIGLVAATSPRSDVTENLASALNAYRAWVEEGRPTTPSAIREVIDSSLLMPGSHGPNAARALTNQPLSGPKVTAFRESFLGSASHVTNDMWGAITNGVDPQELGSEGAYMALSENYRKAAAELGWEPKQAQAASWGFIRTLGNISGLGGKMAGKDREASEVLKMMDDPMVRKYSADIADIFLTSEKVRSRLEGLGINLEEFDAKLQSGLTDFGRGGEGKSGELTPKVAARTAARVEEAKDRAAAAVRASKRVNPKAQPLLNTALGGKG